MERENYIKNFKFLLNNELEKQILEYKNEIEVFDFTKNEEELEYAVLIDTSRIDLMEFLFGKNKIEVKLNTENENDTVLEADFKIEKFEFHKQVLFRVNLDEMDDLERTHKRYVKHCVSAMTEQIIFQEIIKKYRDNIQPVKTNKNGEIYTGILDLNTI